MKWKDEDYPEGLTQADFAEGLIRQNRIMRRTELHDHGINPFILVYLARKGRISRPARGLYEIADSPIDIEHYRAEAAKRVPDGVICLLSALQFHEMTQDEPRCIWMGVARRNAKPDFKDPPTRLVRFTGKSMSMGVKTHCINSVPVRVFEPAKTIADCFRYRKAVGLRVAVEALRSGLKSGKATPDDIEWFARKTRIWRVLDPYLESELMELD